MKIWLDLANSPQVLFFRPIIRELERRGHTLTITTRAYAQTVQLADRFGLSHQVIGQHGGRGLSSLIEQNYLRSVQLAQWAQGHKFDLALSHNSYSQVVAATLRHIRAVTLMDYEYQPLNHLCFRLAHKVIVPEAFPVDMIRKYGAATKAVTYPGVKEQVYLADFIPQKDYLASEGLPVDVPLVVIRPPAPWTAYHRFENDLFDGLLAHLSEESEGYLLFLPRLASQVAIVQHFPAFHIADKVYDGPNLIYYADLAISGGGTMNREAAVLGTPVYTVFRGQLGAVDQYLIDKGCMMQIKNHQDITAVKIQKQIRRELPGQDTSIIARVTDLILDE